MTKKQNGFFLEHCVYFTIQYKDKKQRSVAEIGPKLSIFRKENLKSVNSDLQHKR